MNIVVCVKQVPATSELSIDPETGNLIREGVPGIVNPDDRRAVEAAVSLKEAHGGRVTLITMGPPQAEEALRECLAMGADQAILLTDRAFAGADTWATSYTLGCAIRKIGEFDLILCGRESQDGNTGQVGPQIAEFLGIPQVTGVRAIEISGQTLRARRALEDGYEVVETGLPALLTVTRDLNTPRLPPVDAVMHACRAEIITWTADDLPVDRQLIGLEGSPTRIIKTYAPELKSRQGEIIEGNTATAVETLVTRLRERQLL